MQTAADADVAATSHGIPASGIPSAAAARVASQHGNMPPAAHALLAPSALQQLKQAVQQLESPPSCSKKPTQPDVSLGAASMGLTPHVQQTMDAHRAATAVNSLRGCNMARLLRSRAGHLAASAPSGGASIQAAGLAQGSTAAAATVKQRELEQRLQASLPAALQYAQKLASPARLAGAAAAPGGSHASNTASEKQHAPPSPATDTDQVLPLLLPGGLSRSPSLVSWLSAAGGAAATAAGVGPCDIADADATMETSPELLRASQVRGKARRKQSTP